MSFFKLEYILIVLFFTKVTFANIKTDAFFNKKYDYTNSYGRVTDISDSKNILKIWSEDKNLRFLHDGDLIYFRILSKVTLFCTAHVRSTEEKYLTLRVNDWNSCWDNNEYFKRGTRIVIKSKRLQQRVYDASVHRKIILKRKTDFLNQLKKINNFLWQYSVENLKIIGEYDQKILDVQNAKAIALEQLKSKKQDYIDVQDILKKRLGHLDAEIKFYKVDRRDLNDRWKKDLHLGLPITRRPYEYSRIKRVSRKQFQRK